MRTSIENKLREIAEKQFGGYSYIFEDWNGAAEVATKVEVPAIICLLPTGGFLDFSRGRVKDSEDIAIAFVDKASRDADGNDNEKVYSRMKDTASRFVEAMNKSHYFEPIEHVSYKTILESASSYFTGVFVEMKIKENYGNCL